MNTVAKLPKVMPHIEIPVQGRGDDVLKQMRRGYTQAGYREIYKRSGNASPAVPRHRYNRGLSGGVGYAVMETYRLLEDLRLDVAHLARYSTRPEPWPNTDLPTMYRKKKKSAVSDAGRFAGENRWGDQSRVSWRKVDVLFEDKQEPLARGRPPPIKLVFTEN